MVFGAGLPAIFALGVSMWAKGTDDLAPDGALLHKGNRMALAAACTAFAVVLVAVMLGIGWITQKSLNHYFGISVFGT